MCVCTCVCVLCVCVCVRARARVCLRSFTVKVLSFWISWNAREQINDVVLNTFLSYAKFLNRCFRMKHQTFLTSYFILLIHLTIVRLALIT